MSRDYKNVLEWILSTPWTKVYDNYVNKKIDLEIDTIHGVFRRVAREVARKDFLIFFNRRYTYREIDLLSDAMALMLAEDGVKKGDVVALQLPNTPQYVISLFGILKAGGIVSPMNPLYTSSEIAFQLKNSGAKYFITLDLFLNRYREIEEEVPLRRVYVTSISDALGFPLNLLYRLKEKPPKVVESNRIKNLYPILKRYYSEIGKGVRKPPEVNVTPDDPALIMYTGGTTGIPKGALILHRNVVSNMQQVAEWHPPKKDNIKRGYVYAGVLPWFHIYGLVVTLMTCVYTRSTIVVFPRWDLKSVLKAVQKYKIDVLHGVPTIYTYIVNSPLSRKYKLNSLMAAISGAAPLPVEILKKFEALTGAKLREGYGLTETAVVTHVNPLMGKYKEGSIGVPIPNTYAAIAHPDEPILLPPGEIGEIVISGPQVFAGYYNMPEENKRAFFELGGLRWFRTGDIGYMDEEGYFFVVDRKKDMIKYKGYSVYPREIEEILYKHEAVYEAAVVGIRDPEGVSGELPIAFVVLKKEYEGKISEQDLIEHLRKHLAPYKMPRKILFVGSLPKSAVGKILKRSIRERVKAEIVGGELVIRYQE
ncbi:MAG: long-chain fatty acid--CoA ligase [Sulfolobales archaeon]